MTEIGVVTEISGNRVTVSCGSPGCASCAAAGSCSGGPGRASGGDGTPEAVSGAAGNHAAGGRREFRALNSLGLSLAPGDSVEVSFPGRKTVLSFLRVIVLPLALFVAAYLATGAVFHAVSEGVRALAGFAGLALGIGFSLALRRPDADLPEVTGKL